MEQFDQTPKNSYFNTDIKSIIILIVVFVLVLTALLVLDIKTNYLTSLAARLMLGI